jgi:hypothetical protein
MKNNKQETSVEWLFDKMFDPTYPAGEQINWLEHAKEMQKQQMIEFAVEFTYGTKRVGAPLKEDFIKLYEKNYGGGEQ